MHWKDIWEKESQEEYKYFLSLKEDELLNRVKDNQLGSYYNIWRAIAEKSTLKKSWEVLWNFLKNNPGKFKMLNRYHCAGALFELMDMPDPGCDNELRHSVQWDHSGEEERQKALEKLKKEIQKIVGN